MNELFREIQERFELDKLDKLDKLGSGDECCIYITHLLIFKLSIFFEKQWLGFSTLTSWK